MDYNTITHPMQVSFYFKYSQTQSLKDLGYGTIYYYIMLNNRKSKEKSTKIECHHSRWNGNEQKLNGFDVERQNLKIKEIRQVIEKNNDIFTLLQQSITADELIEMTSVNLKYKKTFFEVFQAYKAEQFAKIRKEGQLKSKANIENSTYESYLKREKKIWQYFKKSNKLQILCVDVDNRFVELMDNWLTQNGCGQLYATKCVKLVKTVMLYAEASKVIKVNFAAHYKTKPVPRQKVNTLHNHDLNKLRESYHLFTATETKYVDVFLFLHETMLLHADLIELDNSQFQHFPNGQIWLRKPRHKREEENNQIQILPLSQTAIDILQKYNGVEGLPKTAASCMNKYFKMASAKAGIEKNVSLKMGRSSGISYKYNKLKMREHSIAIAAGWTSTAHLKDYLDIDYDDFRNEFLGEQA